jgi:hypothetical protein
MNDIEIPANSRMADWRPVFESWQSTLGQILLHAQGEDAPHVHGEHGNSHLLATAASRVEGMSSMREMVGHREPRPQPGRLDICLLTDRRMDLVEAKYREFDLCDDIPRGHLRKDLERACRDADNYRNDHGLFTSSRKTVRRIGIVYIAPYFSRSDCDAAKLSALLDFVRSDMPHDALACNFPDAARALRYYGRKRLYPGVIAVASVVSETSATA